MQAAFLIGPQQIEIRNTPEPELPEDGLILQVETCGVCGSDIRRWKEGPPKGVEGIIPGHEAAGTVIEVGPKVSRFSVGDHLAVGPDIHCGVCYYCERGMYNLCDDLRFLGITPGYPGGFAEKLLLTNEVLENGIVHKMPPGTTFKEGALAELCCSVLANHEKLGTSLNDTVVVLGAGPAGCLHAVIAKARGANLIVSECSEYRKAIVARFKPDLIVNPEQENVIESVREFTGGLGADIVICANPIAETQTEAISMVRKAGTVVLFGGLPKASPMTTLDSNRIHYGEIVVVGAFSYHPTHHERALDLLRKKVIPADSIVTHTLSLDRIDEAFQIAASGTGLKVIATMNI